MSPQIPPLKPATEIYNYIGLVHVITHDHAHFCETAATNNAPQCRGGVYLLIQNWLYMCEDLVQEKRA